MRIAKLIIGDINTLTGGYIYEKRLVDYLRGAGLEADIVSIPNLPYPLHLFTNFWLLFYFAIKKYDLIIEDEMTHPAVWVFNFWAKHVRGMKIIAIVHMLRWIALRGCWDMTLVKFMERQMLRSTNLIIANSNHTSEEIKGMGLSDQAIDVVYPGFDSLQAPQGSSSRIDDSIRLLFVGNWDPRKGLETLLEALHHSNNPGISLDVVGDDRFYPRYTRRVMKKVLQWGLEGRTRFHGRIERHSLGSFYSNADIFVMPSTYEPFGIVFAEAMSFGLPIIAANAGGIPELVEHRKNGLLVPPNDPFALAQAIAELASSAELRQKYGRASYEKSKELNTWEDSFQTILKHLHRLAVEKTASNL